MKTITVFGGSLPKPGSSAYQDAYRLGKLLAESGYTVQTGGYIGTMEAVSKGAAEAGGHVIGVTCDEIEAWRPVAPNQWVKEEKRCATLRERLYRLIDECEAAIALPGGIGTLAEWALNWAEIQIHPDQPKKLLLVGEGWEEVLGTIKTELGDYIPAADQARILAVPDVESAAAVLNGLF